MTRQIKSEEASIVLVGGFNPAIYHPAWFISKGILAEWEYDKNAVNMMPDFSEIRLTNRSLLTVLLNQFILKSTEANMYLPLKDLVVNTFTILGETPIRQMGLNYTAIISLNNKKEWLKFGSTIAPKSPWAAAIPYLRDVNEEKFEDFGLWDVTMHMPRPDDYRGYNQIRIKAVHPESNTISISVNDHYEIEDGMASNMVSILNEKWETSLQRSKEMVSNLLVTQLDTQGQ